MSLNQLNGIQVANKTNKNKAAMLACLKEQMGNVSVSCDHVGINRWTHYDWLKEDKEYAKAVEAISEATTDFVESKLLESINGAKYQVVDKSGALIELRATPNPQAQIFYLKTKGRKRGYVEKPEVDQSANRMQSITFIIKGK